jgi:polyisoprenoid-binding protein YceI
MIAMKAALFLLAAAALAACSKPANETSQAQEPAAAAAASAASTAPAAGPVVPVKTEAPSGAYRLDPTHASLTFRVSHLGFSNYTARFTRFDAELQLDADNPEASSLSATIDPNSLALNAPPPGFDEQMRGPQWFDVAQFPEMRFRSTGVELTGASSARVTGDLTLHGITRPVTLDVTFNGGYPGMSMDPNARIGFSARGTLKRSEFGMGLGVPAPGTTMGVGDEVSFDIETEFTGPALATPPPPQ